VKKSYTVILTTPCREFLSVMAMLLGAILLRLIMINQPFVDHWSWRQSLLAMVAENFYLHGFNIIYPQVNVAGSAPGHVGMEFPLVPYLAALLYSVFGVQEWIARAVPVAFFGLSLPFFYLLVKKVFNQQSALIATGIYSLAPLSIVASRSFLSDMPTLSLSIIAIYLFLEWVDSVQNLKLFMASALVTALAILVKLPSIIIGLTILYVVWQNHGVRSALRLEFWGFAAASLAPSLIWYFHAYLISITEFPFELWGFQRLKLVTAEQFAQAVLGTLIGGLSPIAAGAALLGAALPHRGNYRYLFHWWLLAIAVFWVLAGEGFVMHVWYGLPVLPAAAALGGYGLDSAMRKWQTSAGSSSICAVVIVLFFGSVGYASYDYVRTQYEPWARSYQKAGMALKDVSSPQALVVFADVGDPTGIYYSKRKGCHFYAPADSKDAIEMLVGLRSEGVRYLVFTHQAFWWLSRYREFTAHLDAAHKRLAENPEYIIFELAPIDFTVVTHSFRVTRAPRNGIRESSPGRVRCGCTAFGFQCFKAS
jgi:4-amino-4-deoxy-L-arabinose transferase-like glycosyltransferase